MDTRSAANDIVEELAVRLEDPKAVQNKTNEANSDRTDVDRMSVPPWDSASFSRGPGGIALLFAEIAHTDDRFRTIAHAYIQEAAAHAVTEANGPMEGGLGGLAVATRAVAEGWGAYRDVLAELDERVCGLADRLVAVQRATRETGAPTCPGIVDVTSGLAGIGRYLLHRKENCESTLREVLTCLTTLCDPVVVNGVQVPGWWYDATAKTRVDDTYEYGQVNFGLAHGLPGPLALISLAWQEDVRVPGQDEAIAEMADWLLDRREEDEFGRYWTPYLPLGSFTGRADTEPLRRARPSWCYGAAGIARALEFASTALGRDAWVEAGLDAVRSTLRKPYDTWSINDNAICHGWASSLYLMELFDRNHPDEGFDAHAEVFARKLVENYDPALVFGYRFPVSTTDLRLDLPGFLEGSAGIALALHAHATRRAPQSKWDSILILN